MNRLLLEQIKDSIGVSTKIPPRFAAFLEKVSATYDNYLPATAMETEAEASENATAPTADEARKNATDQGAVNHRLIEELRIANDDLKEFAYIISHDLKAPLRGINTLAEWLITDYADKLDEEGVTNLRFIQKRVNRMHALIDGVLQYSRVSRVKEAPQQLDLNVLVRELTEIFSPQSSANISIENSLPTLFIEETYISQIFQNLIGNAIKHCDRPPCNIFIGSYDDPSNHIFYVKDNGPGIDPRHQERIFKIFETLDGNRENAKSNGVGLTIVKKIVETKGGKIWLESQLGMGATFYFSLPKAVQ